MKTDADYQAEKTEKLELTVRYCAENHLALDRLVRVKESQYATTKAQRLAPEYTVHAPSLAIARNMARCLHVQAICDADGSAPLGVPLRAIQTMALQKASEVV